MPVVLSVFWFYKIYEELAKVGTEVNYAEDENAKGMFCYPTTGKMPTELSEIATSTVVLDALGVNQRIEQYTETEQKNLTYVCKQTYEEEFGDFVQMFWIVGGALSFVLALIGIMNFTNAIVTGILARKKELAMMEAVGMTGKQMKGMLAWEGMFYIVLTGICSICIGSLFSAVILKNLATEMWFLSYHFTVLPILICIPVLAFIAGAIPVIAYGNMEKEAVVERMRGKE